MEKTPARYSLTRAERETVICFDAEERIAHIYTSDPVYIRRLDKMCEEDPETYKCVEVDRLGYFKKYEAPADRIAFRKAPTEARRETAKRNSPFKKQPSNIEPFSGLNPLPYGE